MKRILFIVTALASTATAVDAQGLYFPLDGNLTEQTSSTQGTTAGVRTLPYAEGISGQALRLDGYSNYVSASLSYTSLTPEAMTFSLWIAPETYPMMNAGEAEVTPTYAMVAGNMDASARKGFGLYLNSQGGYEFRCVVLNQVREYIVSDDVIPLGQWSNIVVTMDNANQKLTVYRNGVDVNAALAGGLTTYKTAPLGTSSFLIGKSRETLMSGSSNINTFNGLIDEVRVDNVVKTAEEVAGEYALATVPTIDAMPVTSLINEESAADYGYLRPQFHGMPAKCWTNESHGLVYYNGKYHLFFQKNGNGPYMARLNWGHITSTDLLNWNEEPVAIAPGASTGGLEANDGKGCWSGCVFTDEAFNDGKPTILYTGVSNAKAYIWMAQPKDDDLISWEKTPGQIIASAGNPCCADASDDFRDPYFFSANGSKYIIIGTSNKSGIGTTLLYKYNGSSWIYQGLFFSGTSKATCGRFWEMPNVTPLGNGKYLFTCTPLETSNGVKTLYWIGTIGSDGKFTPDQTTPQTFEAAGSSHDGYGLLSPTIYNDGSRMLALGIVPDKVDGSLNYKWGWAHNYSLPREITLTADGRSIVEKPLSTISSYRKAEATRGRQLEMAGTFRNSSEAQGFRFLKGGDSYAQLSVADGVVTVDLTHLNRTVNDADTYKGIYSTNLGVTQGADITIDAVLDGSILDVFISADGVEGEAFSVRLFPDKAETTDAEVFGTTADAHIWSLDTTSPTGISSLTSDDAIGGGTSFRKCIVGGRLCITNGRTRYSVDGSLLKNN